MDHLRVAAAAAFVLALASPVIAADAPPGAASCSGCHPGGRFVGTAVPRLIGRDATQIIAAMAEFRTGARPATVMDRIAKGYSEDEVKDIAAWFAAQKDPTP
jgi:cytochrome subunit of sulfide dehydrogenase